MRYFITILIFIFLTGYIHGQQTIVKKSEPVNSFQKPQYPGGEMKLQEYLSLNLRYPSEAMSRHIEGEVWVSFVIGEDGMIRDVRTTKKIGFGCEEEAERVVKTMPRWQPATTNGKAVTVNYRLPVVFELTTKSRRTNPDKS